MGVIYCADEIRHRRLLKMPNFGRILGVSVRPDQRRIPAELQLETNKIAATIRWISTAIWLESDCGSAVGVWSDSYRDSADFRPDRRRKPSLYIYIYIYH